MYVVSEGCDALEQGRNATFLSVQVLPRVPFTWTTFFGGLRCNPVEVADDGLVFPVVPLCNAEERLLHILP